MRRRTALALAALLALLAILGGRWQAGRTANPSAIATPPADAHAAIADPLRASTLALPTGASVSGRVTFAAEPAIAQVCLTAAEIVIASENVGGGEKFGLPMHCAPTDERGYYRIGALAPGRYQLSASAPGYMPLVHHEDPPERWIVLARDQARVGLDLAFRLLGVPVTGVVRDVAGGTIAGATVSETDGGLAMTDEAGEFTLWVEPMGFVFIGAFAPGYTTGTAFASPPQAPITLYLSPESMLRGRVVQADTGAPLSDLPVHLQSDQRIDATTGADGSFEIRGLDPGRFKPFVRHAGWCGSANGPLGLGIGETSEPLTIAATRCATVTAQVRGKSSGPPCPSAQVELLDAVGDLIRKAFTDLSGQITLSGLASGAYGVRIICPGHFQRTPESWLFDDAHPTRVTWEVEPARTIRGQVQDHHGQPVALAVLSAVGSWGLSTAGATPTASSR